MVFFMGIDWVCVCAYISAPPWHKGTGRWSTRWFPFSWLYQNHFYNYLAEEKLVGRIQRCKFLHILTVALLLFVALTESLNSAEINAINTSGDGWQQFRARPFNRSKGPRSQLLQTTNPLIVRPLSESPMHVHVT